MNQSIIFSDNETYHPALQQIEFQAQCQGALISCVISVAYLCQLTEQQAQTEVEILSLFDSARFDIEDIAETIIKNQNFHKDGKIYLQSN